MSDFIIDTKMQVQQKLALLQNLINIRIAAKILSEKYDNDGESQIDTCYQKLKCELVPIAKGTDEHNLVLEYIQNTHAPTHSTYKLELVDLFKTGREGEDSRYTKSLHNKMLLWYGSRLTDYVGILSQGLRIAPPEAPATCYMFGKGVYFTDMVSKSANYCFANPTNNTGILLLCEVALGNCNEKHQADFNAHNLPTEKHSTKGVGKIAPPESSYRKIDGDVQVPIGKAEGNNDLNVKFLSKKF